MSYFTLLFHFDCKTIQSNSNRRQNARVGTPFIIVCLFLRKFANGLVIFTYVSNKSLNFVLIPIKLKMTVRQKILKLLYPLFSFYKRKKGEIKIIRNPGDILPAVSFYNFTVTLTNGNELSFEKLRGKKVLLVNSASDCGYTGQYEELQKLYEHYKEELEIIAFPSNDFKQQEKRSDQEIAKFCRDVYGIKFPVARKSHVLSPTAQNPVFHWLTHKESNGWNDQEPQWNFSKYLVNEDGVLIYYFDPAVSPLGPDMVTALNE
jgi:glutathione peroxidase